jgi:hypothetical protein
LLLLLAAEVLRVDALALIGTLIAANTLTDAATYTLRAPVLRVDALALVVTLIAANTLTDAATNTSRGCCSYIKRQLLIP